MPVCIVQLLTNKHIAHLETILYITNIIGTFFKRVNYHKKLQASLSRKSFSYLKRKKCGDVLHLPNCHLEQIFLSYFDIFDRASNSLLNFREIFAKLKLNRVRKDVFLLSLW